MIDEDRIIQWLLHQKYIGVNEKSTEMTEEFEKEHQWELSRNCFFVRIFWDRAVDLFLNVLSTEE